MAGDEGRSNTATDSRGVQRRLAEIERDLWRHAFFLRPHLPSSAAANLREGIPHLAVAFHAIPASPASDLLTFAANRGLLAFLLSTLLATLKGQYRAAPRITEIASALPTVLASIPPDPLLPTVLSHWLAAPLHPIRGAALVSLNVLAPNMDLLFLAVNHDPHPSIRTHALTAIAEIVRQPNSALPPDSENLRTLADILLARQKFPSTAGERTARFVCTLEVACRLPSTANVLLLALIQRADSPVEHEALVRAVPALRPTAATVRTALTGSLSAKMSSDSTPELRCACVETAVALIKAVPTPCSIPEDLSKCAYTLSNLLAHNLLDPSTQVLEASLNALTSLASIHPVASLPTAALTLCPPLLRRADIQPSVFSATVRALSAVRPRNLAQLTLVYEALRNGASSDNWERAGYARSALAEVERRYVAEGKLLGEPKRAMQTDRTDCGAGVSWLSRAKKPRALTERPSPTAAT